MGMSMNNGKWYTNNAGGSGHNTPVSFVDVLGLLLYHKADYVDRQGRNRKICRYLMDKQLDEKNIGYKAFSFLLPDGTGIYDDSGIT